MPRRLVREGGRLVLLAATLLGCRGGASTPDGDAPAEGRDWQHYPAVATVTGAAEIDVLGDVHGDLTVTTRVLAAAGLVTDAAPHHWTGADRVLVVTGDVIDKGATATPIIDLFIALEAEAAAAGGRVIVTLGNHEAEFVANPNSDKVEAFRAELMTLGLDPVAVATGESRFGAWLLTRPVAALVDDWFFSHAGNSRAMSIGEIGTTFATCFDAKGRPDFNCPFLLDDDSLLEAEQWWDQTGPAVNTLDFNLAILPASHIVFGHDPGALEFPGDPAGDRQPGEMAMRYGGRLFLIDVGMSYAVGFSSGALLRVSRNPDAAIAVYVDGTTRALWP